MSELGEEGGGGAEQEAGLAVSYREVDPAPRQGPAKPRLAPPGPAIGPISGLILG